jgi:hypothetical protein
MPKTPKFRARGGNPKSRSGKPGNDREEKKTNSNYNMLPQKIRQELIVPAANVPEGSRFKGYQEYAVQELEIRRFSKFETHSRSHFLNVQSSVNASLKTKHLF